MSAAAPITVPDSPPPIGAAPRVLIGRQLGQLAELAEIGMELARAAGRRAVSEEGDGAAGLDPTLSYTRAARAVRLTISLQSRLMADLATLDKDAAVARVGEASRRRQRVERLVNDAAEDEGHDTDEARQFAREARERLTDVDDSVLLDRPIEEVVALICRDLGLSPAFAAPAFTGPGGGGPQLAVPPAPGNSASPPTPSSVSGSVRDSRGPTWPDALDLPTGSQLDCRARPENDGGGKGLSP